MKFNLDGLTVYFPYSRIYLEQYQYMQALKRTLDAAAEDVVGVSINGSGMLAGGGGMGGRAGVSTGGGGGKHALLEMPTGTGKTVCLLSLITSYQYAHPKSAGKLVYCTRTVPEMNAVMEELGVVLRYREKCILEEERAMAMMATAAAAEVEDDEETTITASMEGRDGSATARSAVDTERIENDGDTTMTEEGKDDETNTANSTTAQQQHPQKKRRKIYHGDKTNSPSKKDNNNDEDDDKSTPTLGPSVSPRGAGMNGTLAICLSSRRNMCINESVLQMSDREGVDAACRALTAPWARERAEKARSRQVMRMRRQQQQQHQYREEEHMEEAQSSMQEDDEAEEGEDKEQEVGGNSSYETCQYYENFAEAGESTSMPSGIYDLNSLKLWAKSRQWCPYYLTRRAINHASILVFNYQYMLDPKVAKMVSSELESSSIIVFDEAHNIDSVCIEAFSVTVDSRRLELATRSLGRLSSEVSKVKATDSARLQAEYQNLVNGLIDQGLLVDGGNVEIRGGAGNNNAAAAIIQPGITSGLASNVLSEDVINECVPGNIRRAEHFIAFMKKIVEYMKSRLRTLSGSDGGGGVTSETPLAFLHRMVSTTSLDAKALKFAYSRLSSLLNTLRVTNLDDYGALSDVADFACLVSTYSEGPPRFAIISEPNVGSSSSYAGPNNPGIQLACLDSSLAISPVFKRFGSVIITSGTLSPMNLYPRLLQFEPAVMESFNMSTFRPCIHPLVISRGSDQLPVSTRFQDRGDLGVVRNYGTMMVELCSAIPDGIVAFFTSYSYMESIISEWDGMGIMRQLTKSKLVFIETKDVVETTMALDNFRRACDSGRGAVFLSVARGKVSEGINFDRHYGRAVIMFGVPFQYTLSHILRARLEYLQTQYQIREQDFLNFDALRQTSQCVGRVIRSKIDYGLMIFADARYNRHDKRSKLPKWILQFLGDGQLNLSTDTAVGQVKHFLRVMAQPVDQKSLKEVLLTVEEVKALVR